MLYGVKSKAIVPYSVIHADTDVSSSAPSDDKEPTKPESRDYSTETPEYTRSFWESHFQVKNLEEHLASDSQIYLVDIPCGISRYDVCAISR